jgi:methylmalonyl-CoA mutase cobalamin-binding domain/chain
LPFSIRVTESGSPWTESTPASWTNALSSVTVHTEGPFAAQLIRSAIGSFAMGAADGDRQLAREFEAQLEVLAEALATGRQALLDQEMAWRKVAHRSRGVADELLVDSLNRLRGELEDRLPDGPGRMAARCLEDAAKRLADAPKEQASYLEDGPLVNEARRYLECILEADRDGALAIVDELLRRPVEPGEIHEQIVTRTQRELGRMWQMNEAHIGEEHFGSAVADEALSRIRAHEAAPARTGERVLLAAVAGNMHDLGIRMVADHMRWAGFDAVLLGANMPAEDIVQSAIDFDTKLVVLSAHLATHVTSLARAIKAIRAAKRLRGVPVLVGGPPFAVVEDLWQVVGADGVSLSAPQAPVVARGLLEEA